MSFKSISIPLIDVVALVSTTAQPMIEGRELIKFEKVKEFKKVKCEHLCIHACKKTYYEVSNDSEMISAAKLKLNKKNKSKNRNIKNNCNLLLFYCVYCVFSDYTIHQIIR